MPGQQTLPCKKLLKLHHNKVNFWNQHYKCDNQLWSWMSRWKWSVEGDLIRSLPGSLLPIFNACFCISFMFDNCILLLPVFNDWIFLPVFDICLFSPVFNDKVVTPVFNGCLISPVFDDWFFCQYLTIVCLLLRPGSHRIGEAYHILLRPGSHQIREALHCWLGLSQHCHEPSWMPSSHLWGRQVFDVMVQNILARWTLHNT